MLDLVAILIYTKLKCPNPLYPEDCFSDAYSKKDFFLNYLSSSFVDDEIIIY
jgi:hypothetical protein